MNRSTNITGRYSILYILYNSVLQSATATEWEKLISDIIQ